MLNFILSIPEEIGWVLVGATGAYCIMWMHKLGKLFVTMWKEWHEPDVSDAEMDA